MKVIITIIAMMSLSFSYAQNINWSSMNDGTNNIMYVNFGYDFGLTVQVGYGHKVGNSKPIMLTADYSFPMGNKLVDDFKVRLGGQIPVYRINDFIISTKVYGVFRRHQTTLVNMASFGSEMSAVIGCYKPTWHLAGEFGFDKSIITHLKHSGIMRDNFLGITDGWFIPSGGHFFYGIQGSKTIGNVFELSLRAGLTNAQFNDENALLPYYAQLGFTWKLSSK